MFDGRNNNIMFLYYFLHPYASEHNNNYNVIFTVANKLVLQVSAEKNRNVEKYSDFVRAYV